MASTIGQTFLNVESADHMWEYDAPQFFDFNQANDDTGFDNSSDYFSIDHETALSSTMNANTVPPSIDPSPILPSTSTNVGTDLSTLAAAVAQLLPVRSVAKDSAFKRPQDPRRADGGLAASITNGSTVSTATSEVSLSGSVEQQLGDAAGADSLVSQMQQKLTLKDTNAGDGDSAAAESDGAAGGNPAPDASSEHVSKHVGILTPHRAAAAATRDPRTPASGGPRNNELERGRVRCVDIITSAKKRLSMSVDRGQAKLTKMAAALSGNAHKTLFSIAASPGIIHTTAATLHCLAHGSADLQQSQLSGHDDDQPGQAPAAASTSASSAAADSNDVAADVAAAVGPLDADAIVDRLTRGNTLMVQEEALNRTAVVPHRGIPFRPPGATDKKRTTVKPFSFEERNRRMLEAKQQKIAQVIDAEKKLRQFHAQPFPEIIYTNPPARNAPPSSARNAPPPSAAAQRTEPARKKVTEKVEAKQEKAETKPPVFKAKQPTVLHRSPFVPHKSVKPLTGSAASSGVGPFHLETERRAAKRAEWESWKRDKDQRELAERAAREQLSRGQQEAELKRQRQATVHHALPVPRFIKRNASAVPPADGGNDEKAEK